MQGEEKIKMQGVLSRIPEGRPSGIPEDGLSHIPQGEVVVVHEADSPGRGLLFSTKISAAIWGGDLAQESQQPLSHISPQLLSLQTLFRQL